MNKEQLCKAALEARRFAHAPYSGCLVGAALLAENGTVYTGCNVENASYGATLCAERAAFAKAVSEGQRRFSMLAIAGGEGDTVNGGFPPCGICRQVMAEFCSPDFTVLVVTSENTHTEYTLAELLPAAFSLPS